jgi:hypothetical protein
MLRFGLRATLPFEQGASTGSYFLLPLRHHRRMNAMLLSDLIDRLDPAYRLKADLPLELRAVHFPLLYFRHSPLSSRDEHSLNRCLKL